MLQIIYPFTAASFSKTWFFFNNISLKRNEFWTNKMKMGVKERNMVCSRKIHFPFFEVGLNRQIPLEMVDNAPVTPDTVDLDSFVFEDSVAVALETLGSAFNFRSFIFTTLKANVNIFNFTVNLFKADYQWICIRLIWYLSVTQTWHDIFL